ncbi:type VI secretion system Vgr family protein [Lysobacter sp. H23M47]|uniref:type VI secretion system Vgr family protein n=1 Tax=Lysobacter sp. H23M47 TaxID=2781024 RepID=UPI001880BAF5|nr:type VI secretion system Vgr family protein [Lysobacter sp. H23M47]QOW24888.1 type VI secretion system tip protein VgrG [Lysobacter sp. H23M47]
MSSGVSVPQAVLAALSRYRDADRLYALAVGGASSDLIVERWQGRESLSQGFEWWIDALSTDAGLDLDALLGQSATFSTRAADCGRIPRSGLIRQAECVGSDGGLARYRLCLVPWTWLLTQGRHSRVFQDRTVLEIVEAVFDDYAPLASWQVGDEVGPFLAEVRPRSYCVQYRETDFDFVSRLLAEEGLGWRLQETGEAGHELVLFARSGNCPQDETAAGGGGIRFHRSDATESSDTVQSLGAQHSIAATDITLLSHDYKSMSLGASVPLDESATDLRLESYDPTGAYSFASQAEAARYAGLLADAARAQGARWLGRSTVRSFRAGQWFALTQAPVNGDAPPELLLEDVQQAGINNLPDVVREGASEHLGAAPPIAEPDAFGAGGDRAASLSAGTGALIASAADGNGSDAKNWQAIWARAEAIGYANSFIAVPRELPWRPVLADDTGLRINPRPTAPGYQSAIVVGDGGSPHASGVKELHSDALGRVRVRFHFQTDQGTSTAADSCWLRVAQRYAGPGVGSQFLPRIGQEVLVGFLDGDIDRPMVVGALYNGQGEGGIAPTPGGEAASSEANDLFAQAGDHRPGAQANRAGGNAPAWHGMSSDADGHRNAAAMSGFKSREFGGDGHNRLVFDDSDGQLRLQLATTHAATQLNLGHLIHQSDNYRGSFRGEGFELRTDQWGAVRSERGLWISATANDAEAPAGEHVAALALLRQASQLAGSFNEMATTHQTVRLAAHQGATAANSSRLIEDQAPLEALLASAGTVVTGAAFGEGTDEAPERNPAGGDGRVPHSGDAIIGLTAPAGIGIVAGQSLHWSVGETLTVASGEVSNLAVAGDLRIHAGQAIGWLAGAVEGNVTSEHALALVTAEGDLDIQAQKDAINLQSRDRLKVVSANAEVDLAAGKTVHLATSGGASITIEGGNIVIECPGNITVHAAKKSFVGPAQLSREMNSWPETKFDQSYVVRHRATDEPMADTRVELTRADGARMSLVTDAEGKLPIQKGLGPEKVVIKILGKE